MNKAKKPRLKISTGYNKRTRKDIFDKRKYTLTLGKTEIALLKATLQYWLLDDGFGYALWGIQAATFGSNDLYYRRVIGGTLKADGLWGMLNKLCKVKAEYGYWGDIERLTKMCKKEVDEYKKQAQELEKEYGMDFPQLIGRSEEELKRFKQEKKAREKRKETNG